jgi:hypothetical protein
LPPSLTFQCFGFGTAKLKAKKLERVVAINVDADVAVEKLLVMRLMTDKVLGSKLVKNCLGQP